MEELTSFEQILRQLLDGIITNVSTFDWSKMATILKLLEKPLFSQYFTRIILCKLEGTLKNYFEPYISLHALIFLETITNKHREILQELSTNDLLDVLIDSANFSGYENIRKKIVLLFQNWSYGRRKIRFGPIKMKLEKEGFKFSPENLIETKHVPEGICYKCERRKSKIICAACVQLHCFECSQKTAALPQFGFEGPVKVCDGCYNNYGKPRGTASTSTSTSSHLFLQNTVTKVDNIVLKTIECPICLEVMKKPIIQCKSGHSMCQSCTIHKISRCPICREEITATRNYVVELLIENQRTNCAFTSKGCRIIVNLQEKEPHEATCKFRQVQCEGKKFCNWQCSWVGSYHELGQHFSDYHKKTLLVNPKVRTLLKNTYNPNQNCYYIQFVTFSDGQKFFWYKQKIDIIKQKVFWTVQLIAPQEEADRYCYEIMIFNGPVRNFKVTEICTSDTSDAEEIFKGGKCVSVPLETLKKYINEKNEFFCTLSILNVAENLPQHSRMSF